jgi:hypothetical protein
VTTSAPATSKFSYLTVDGVDCGFVASEVVGSEVTLKGDLFLHRSMYDWIAAAWEGTQGQRSGQIVPYGQNHKFVFADAYITRTGLPDLDATKKQPAALTLGLKTGSLQTVPASPVDDMHAPIGEQTSQARWLRSTFQVEIEGVDCTRVFHVRALTLRSPDGPTSEQELPHLEISLRASTAISWKQWQSDLASAPRKGAIRYLGTDLRTELARVEMSDLELLGLVQPGKRRPAGRVAPTVATISCSKMKFVFRAAP